MQIEDITIEVRSLALGRLGQIDLAEVSDLKIVKNFNNVGAWTMSLRAEYDMAQQLAQTGRGIIVIGPNKVKLLTGPVLNWTKDEGSDDVIGTYSFIGCDDQVHISDGLAYPDPAIDDVLAQTVTNDVRNGPAETLLIGYFSDNIGPTAQASRMRSWLDTQPDLGRGAITNGSPRFDNLGTLMGTIAASGGIGFDMVQNADKIELTIYEPEDKSDYIQMDINNDLLKSTSYGFGAPTATRVVVAGQGDGTDRQFYLETSDVSEASEAAWGRIIEYFQDRRDTSDVPTLEQAGQDTLAANAATTHSLKVVPADEDTMIYAVDWFLGDIVGAVVDGELVTAVVTSAGISIDANGVHTSATIGDPVGFDYESKLIQQTQSNTTAIKALQTAVSAGAAAGGGGYQLGSTVAWFSDTEPSWGKFLNGQELSRADFSGIFALLGTTYGDGDGSTTFNLPDLTGQTLYGYKDGDATFGTLGELIGALEHSHNIDKSKASAALMLDSSHSWVTRGGPTWSTGAGNTQTGVTWSGGSTASSSQGIEVQGETDDASSLAPGMVANFVICVATSSGDFDTEVQTALVADVSDLKDAADWTGANRPAFQCLMSAGATKSGTVTTSILICNTAEVNVGGCYNTATGIFTAPVDGLYEFDFQGCQSTATGGPEMVIYKNGALLYDNWVIGYTTAYMMFSGTARVQLVEGDTISLRWRNNNDVTATMAAGRCRFSGHYLG